MTAGSCATPRASGSCSTTSPTCSQPRRPTPKEEADRWYDDHINNRRPPELLPRDEVARAINSEIKAGPRLAARWRLPRHRHPAQRRVTSTSDCRRCTTSSRSSPTSTSPPSRWRSGRPATTSWAGSRSMPRPQASTVPGLFAAGEVGRRDARRQPARRQLAVGPAGLRRAGGTGRRGLRRRGAPRPARGRGRGRRGDGRGRWRLRTRGRREPLRRCSATLQETMQDLVGIIRTEDELRRGARRARDAQASGPQTCRCRAAAPTTRAGTSPSTCRHADGVRMVATRRPRAATRAGAGTPGRTTRPPIPSWGKVNLVQRIDDGRASRSTHRAAARDARRAQGAVRGGATDGRRDDAGVARRRRRGRVRRLHRPAVERARWSST